MMMMRWLGGGVALAAMALTALAFFSTAAAPASADPAIDAQEQAFLTLINNYRAANGLGGLSLNTQLNNASDWMSNDLATRADCVFSHTDSLGRDPFQRMAAFGYSYNTWKGENLVAGAQTAQAAFDLWKNSPGHNANMLNPNFTVIGIGRFSTGVTRSCPPGGTEYGWYWTTDFGGQGSSPPPAPTEPPPPPPDPTPTKAPPPPDPTPEPTPEPTPTPTPEPTPTPTPSPTPSPTPTPIPSGDLIESQVRGYWQRLTVVTEVQDSVLRSVSYLAERYLIVSGGLLALETDEETNVGVADVGTGELWLAALKS